MPQPTEKFTRFNLLGGEDTYSSQVAQNPATSRRLQGIIPSLAANFEREQAHRLLALSPTDTAPGQLNGPIGWVYEAYFSIPETGDHIRFFLVATGGMDNKIYVLTVGAPNNWVALISNIAAYPQAVILNNKLLISDGSNSWTVVPNPNYTALTVVVQEGFPIPQHAPKVTTQPSATPGVISAITINAAGTGYRVGDVILPESGSFDAELEVISVGASFAVTGLAILSGGTAYTTGTAIVTTDLSGGSGTGLTVNITSVTSGSSTSISAITRTNGVTTLTLSAPIPSLIAGLYLTIMGESDNTLNNEFQAASVDPTGLIVTFNQPGYPDSSGSTGGSAQLSGVNVLSNRYYWTTWVDNSEDFDGSEYRAHESSSSPRSVGTGPLTNAPVQINPRSGTVSVPLHSTAVTGIGTDFDQSDVGQVLWAFARPSGPVIPTLRKVGSVASVQNSQQLSLAVNTTLFASNSTYIIAPDRATAWNLYASESESSNVGYLLATIPLGGSGAGLNNGVQYYDQQQFQGATNSIFNGNTTQRPYRSDPPVASKISTVHKRRNFHRRETRPNFFLFSAYEEVLQFQTTCAPEESYPGTDANTISDIINETSFPDQSREVRNIVSHGDACFIFSERNCFALYGESIDDFSLTQATAFSVGAAGRYVAVSMPHGLAFVSYDGKVYLYPTQFVFWAVLGDATSALVEISKPKRITFEKMNLANAGDTISLTFYNFGRRDWLVLNYQDTDLVRHVWVYDFEVQGWFEIAVGMNISSIAVFEPQDDGYKVLVGGTVDGYLYVLDDVSGNWVHLNADQPSCLFRTALIDFGRPDLNHLIKYIEFEVSNPDLGSAFTVSYYKDPIDVDNPINPQQMVMQPQRIGAGKFRCFPADLGTLCNRALVEISIPSDQNQGVIRSISLYAEPASPLIG